MSNLFYVFNTEAEALAAEQQISLLGGAPIIGKNAKTGEITPEKTKTTRWAIPRQRLDGKWCFPRVSDEILAQYPQEIINGFNSAFNYTFEEYDPLWFPQTEEEEEE